MEIIWSDNSKEDLREFFDHIRSGTESSAQKYINRIIEYTEILKYNPNLGKKICINYNNLEYRILIYKKHNILYSVSDNINIISVIHSSRNMDKFIKIIKSLNF